jgi:hypothetical protein
MDATGSQLHEAGMKGQMQRLFEHDCMGSVSEDTKQHRQVHSCGQERIGAEREASSTQDTPTETRCEVSPWSSLNKGCWERSNLLVDSRAERAGSHTACRQEEGLGKKPTPSVT